MKWIVYKLTNGVEKAMEYKEDNLKIVKEEALNGEYTIEEYLEIVD